MLVALGLPRTGYRQRGRAKEEGKVAPTKRRLRLAGSPNLNADVPSLQPPSSSDSPHKLGPPPRVPRRACNSLNVISQKSI